ncbi:MAG: phosphotransferase [Elusimicrobia bacterium]|nr:phosphotransferase [Elusimicrobiota bacterium]
MRLFNLPTPEEALKEIFQKQFGETPEKIENLKGDGSNRRLLRLHGAGRSVIGVIGPDQKENRAFLYFSRHFRRAKLPVPEIYAVDEKQDVYLEEDLGDTTLFAFLSENRTPKGPAPKVLDVYKQVVRLLPQFQITAAKSVDYAYSYPRAGFDKQSMMWDLNHFKYYFLQLADIPFDEQALENDFNEFADFLLAAPGDFFLYRDFQSRNIMIREGKPWFIDYQGGRKGALQYDIASLLFDAKADLSEDTRRKLLDDYLEAAGELTPVNRGEFMKYFWGFVLIRIMQAMGAYGLRGFYERKTHFLQSIPYAVRNIEFLLRTARFPTHIPALITVMRRIVGSSYLRQFGKASLNLTVRIQSFSYRQGIPSDEVGHGGGYVFDCRALPNPGRHEAYARLNGLDPEIAAFLNKEPAVKEFMKHVAGLVDANVSNYRSRNFTDLMVSFGCTGGLHRSVYCAEALARHLKETMGAEVGVRHRELEKSVPVPSAT